MARQLTIEFPNAFYHVMSRGLNRQNLFYDDEDFEFFLGVLTETYQKYNLVVFSYCLMNNHYHCFIQTLEANLSLVIKYVNETYARYFLKKYAEKDGHVFKGRYKKKLVQSDQYFLQLLRYIHLNPVKAGIVSNAQDWKWSSYRSFIGCQRPPEFLDIKSVLKRFSSGSLGEARRYLINFTNLEEGFDWDPEAHTHAKLVLGSKWYFNQIVSEYIDDSQLDQNIECYQHMKQYKKRKFNQTELVELLKDFDVTEKERLNLLAYLLKEYGNLSLKEIGIVVNKKPKTVSASIILTKKKMSRRNDLKEALNLKLKNWNLDLRPEDAA